LALTKFRNASSKSLRVNPTGSGDARRSSAPRRPGYRSSSSGSDTRSRSPRTSASCHARSSPRLSSTAAKSKIVRNGEVTGIPSSIMRSSSATTHSWQTISRRLALPWGGDVTSGRSSPGGINHQRRAAERWLKQVRGPAAKTAAIHRPFLLIRRYPTL
jgi:hypothetical protein